MFSKLTLVVTALLLCAIAPHAAAQCTADNLKSVSEFEKKSLVIDVRPDQINQFRGKSSFNDQASIVLVNMNPFLFSYSLKVDQTEIQDTGFLNFLKLLGSPVTDLIDSASAASKSVAFSASEGGNLDLLITRTNDAPTAPHSSCEKTQVDDAKKALKELAEVRAKVLEQAKLISKEVTDTAARYLPARKEFLDRKDKIFDSSSESIPLCVSANELHYQLTNRKYPDIEDMRKLLKSVRELQSMVDELKNTAGDYKNEYETCPARAKGLSYADNLVRLANELAKVGAAHETRVNALINETKGYDALVKTIAGLKNQNLQREYTVVSNYDISALDITATAVPLSEESGLPGKDLSPQRVFGDVQRAQSASSTSSQSNPRLVNVGATESAQGVRVFAAHRAGFNARAQAADGDGNGDKDGEGESGGGAKQIKAKGTIGARRFEVSAGMAFSGLDRQEFKPVLGYPRNAQGEFIDPETGNTTTTPKLTQVVGFTEQSSRRFAPMALLHYRMPFHRNVFLSAGITGKNDDYGLNLEYLLGPSVLYKNLFFTFGGYAGKQQKLAGDLYQGAPVEGDFAVRKDYKWSWGFSFTYKIPLGSGTGK